MPSSIPAFSELEAEIYPNLVKDWEPGELAAIFQVAEGGRTYDERADIVCNVLVGKPYQVNPLGGGPDQAEKFVVSLHGFDCVTFFETVTALALSTEESGFLARLHLLRYREGRTDYFTRRHYMAHWREDNLREGRVQLPAGLPPETAWPRRLSALPVLGLIPTTVRGWPKQRVAGIQKGFRCGDLAFFITSRRDLDYFHTGVLRVCPEEVQLIHASRSQGKVVSAPLSAFLARNRMSGVTVLRPIPFSQG